MTLLPARGAADATRDVPRQSHRPIFPSRLYQRIERGDPQPVLSFPPDWTFLAQIGLFLLVWQCLRRFVFEPNQDVLQARLQQTDGVKDEAAAVKAETQAMRDEHQRRLAETRAQARQRVDAAYQDSEIQAREAVETARKEADASIADVRETIEQEIRRTRQTLESDLPDFAREIGEKLLERRISA